MLSSTYGNLILSVNHLLNQISIKCWGHCATLVSLTSMLPTIQVVSKTDSKAKCRIKRNNAGMVVGM